jgi:hypothetical protein
LKLSFLGLGRESPQLELYGKLPIAKDYLRIGCGDGAGRELREWLDRTFGTVRSSSEQIVLDEPLRFLGQSTDEPLLGCLWPSSDAGGLRVFPFTLFVRRRRKTLGADIEDGLVVAEGVWRWLAETRERCLAYADGERMLVANRGRELALGSIGKVEGAHADFDPWIAALWPSEGRNGLLSVFERLLELGRDGYRGPYRLPLARELPLRDQVLGWCSALEGLRALSKGEVPTLFFPPRSLVPTSAPASLVVSRGPLVDNQVSWLTAWSRMELGPADFSGHLDRAVGGTTPSEGRSSLRESIRSALAAFGSPR